MTTDAEKRPDVSVTPEGGGHVARCVACDYEVWRPEPRAAEAAVKADHKTCSKIGRAMVARRLKAQRLRSRP